MALPLLFSFLGGGLAKAGVLGAAGSFLSNPLIMSAIGSGLGTTLETGDAKKGLASGIGSFAGGKLLGSMMGGGPAALQPGQTAVGTGTSGMTRGPANALAGMTGEQMLPPTAASGGSRLGDIARAGMDFGSSAQGIGSMFGSALGGSLVQPKASKSDGQPDISQFRPMERTVRMPGEDFVPGRSGEFDYGVSTPYTSDYFTKYAPRGMAMGGMVGNPYDQPMPQMMPPMATPSQMPSQVPQMMPPMGMPQQMMPPMGMPQQMMPPMGMAMGGQVMQRNDPYHGPLMMSEGGIADVGAMPPPAEAPNEREVISAAVSAVKGQHPQPEIALGAFLSQYGEEALRDLVDRVQSGEFEDTQERFANGENGEVRGPGDGTGVDDMVPAIVDGQSDVLLSDGEFVLRKDATDALNEEFGPEFTDRMNKAGARAPQAVKQMVSA